MKKITDVSELRLIQMDILSYVDKVCRENGIKYSLAGGTLIGAVRLLYGNSEHGKSKSVFWF